MQYILCNILVTCFLRQKYYLVICPILVTYIRYHLYFITQFLFQDKTPIAATLLELKQKQFTNILFELPKGMSVNEFFHTTMDIGLAGEGTVNQIRKIQLVNYYEINGVLKLKTNQFPFVVPMGPCTNTVKYRAVDRSTIQF